MTKLLSVETPSPPDCTGTTPATVSTPVNGVMPFIVPGFAAFVRSRYRMYPQPFGGLEGTEPIKAMHGVTSLPDTVTLACGCTLIVPQFTVTLVPAVGVPDANDTIVKVADGVVPGTSVLSVTDETEPTYKIEFGMSRFGL